MQVTPGKFLILLLCLVENSFKSKWIFQNNFKETKTLKKRYVLIACLLILLYLLTVFISGNYDLSEFKLSIKSLVGQELTFKEMKGSSIYKAYNQINSDTKVEEINNILHKKSKNIARFFETWSYTYGYVSVCYNENEKPRVFVKVVSFETPYTIKLNEKELYSVFECNSLEQMNSILGESVLLGRIYTKDGKITVYNYEWGIKTNFSEEFVDDIKTQYGEYVRFPYSPFTVLPSIDNKNTGKFILRVSIKADNSIEGFSLVDYKKRK